MAAIFVQTDDDANASALAALCSGNSNNTGKASCKATVGGTAGVAEDTVTIDASAADLNAVWFEIDGIDDYDGAAGDWTVRINISTGNHNLVLDECHICRVNSSYVNQESLGSLVGIGDNLNTLGVRSLTVNQASSTTIASGDKIIIVVAFDNLQSMTNTLGFTAGENIDAPGTIVLPIISASVADAITVTEAFDREARTRVSVSDAATVAEAGTLLFERPIRVQESVTVALEAGAGNLEATPADAISAADATKVVLSPLAVHADDSPSLTELVKAVLQLGTRPADAVSVNEAVIAALQLGIRPADLIALAESVKAVIDLGVRLDDAVSVAEDVAAALVAGGDLTVEVSDDAAVAEVIQIVISPLSVHADEATALAEMITAVLNVVRLKASENESVAVAEFLKTVLDPLAVYAGDSISLAEFVNLALQLGVRLADVVGVSENVTAQVVTTTALDVDRNDAITLVEAVTLDLSSPTVLWLWRRTA